MKSQSHFSQLKPRGAALIAVLCLIVLMAALVTVFLLRTSVERTASASYDAAAGTRLLAETTVNAVQATINEATTGTGGVAWASQPGAIRIFDSSGTLSRIYRLYSGTALASNTTTGSILAADVPPGGPTGWSSQPALWVDLNKPVTVSGVSGGTTGQHLVFPILDPRDPKNPGSLEQPNVLKEPDPSNPSDPNKDNLAGFSITAAPGATAQQPAPMPVRWLYVLRNGEIVTPTIDGDGTVRVAGGTKDNPITGRIAYWADDETSKVNVNTAAGSMSERGGQILPAPWDTPRFRIWEERMLFSENQPVHAEYQRYPGHPATTDLYAINKALGITSTGYPPVMTGSTSPQPAPLTTASEFFKLLPRYADDNSSQGGSRNTTKAANPPPINGGVAKQERLLTSVGEWLYNPSRVRNPISRQQSETGKFFLTSFSRAPEVTLFGTPRIAMWPVDKDETRRTAFDKLIAFCATTGDSADRHAYYVQRGDSRSGTSDYTAIARNQQLFSYLQRLTSATIPGYGGSFGTKYQTNNERDQILAEMMDYIRSTNLFDHSIPTSNTTFVRFTSNPSGMPGGKGQAVPLKIGNARGLGRAQTLSEIGIQLICTADGNSPLGPYQAPVSITDGAKTGLVSPVYGSSEDPLYVSNLPVAQYLRNTGGEIIGLSGTSRLTTVGSGTTGLPAGDPFPANQTLTTTGEYGGPLAALAKGEQKLQAMLLFEIASPMMGFDSMDTANAPAYQLKVDGVQNLAVNGQHPFPSRTVTGTGALSSNQNGNGTISKMSTRVGSIQGTGGLLGFRYLLIDYQKGRLNGWSYLAPTSDSSPYPFVSNPFTVSSTAPLSLGGGFTAELRVPSSSGVNTYQTFNVNFPAAANVPLPDLPKMGIAGTVSGGSAYTSLAADWWGYDFRISKALTAAIDNTGSTTPNLGLGSVIRADAAYTGTWNYGTSITSVRMPTFTSQAAAGSDVVRTLVVKDGDYRLTAALDTVNTDTSFEKGPGYDSGVKLGNLFKDQGGSLNTAGVDNGGKLVQGANYGYQMTPKIPSTMNAQKQLTWDWDNGLPREPDGAYSNKADEGNTYIGGTDSPYYNRETQSSNDISSYFTANRIVSSPVMFGSLPSGVKSGETWRTLLFRPQLNRPFDAAGPKDHLLLDLFSMPVVEPYAISEPFSTAGKVNMNYQIVPFTYIKRNTALRAVLSSELVARVPKGAEAAKPFSVHTYYKPTEAIGSSLVVPPTSNGVSIARLPLSLSETDGTLRQFKEKFEAWDLFKSPSEICDIYLVPSGYKWTSNTDADAAWYGDQFALVGDNVRERPYSNIYPRLTTKSNTFTVHYTVQTLKNPPSVDPATWVESKGVVTGELRGSTTLERFLDPADAKIPDYAANASAPSLDNFYQWRVISSTTFAP